MRALPALAALMTLVTLCGPARAVPGGELGTLPIGEYRCELPGDAGSLARLPVPEENFEIIHASSYAVGGARGTYLLTGDDAVMTSGPFDDKRYVRVSPGVLKPVGPDGKEQPMRCVLAMRRGF